MMKIMAMAAAVMFSMSTPAAAQIEWNAVDQALGRPGTEQAGGVHRYGFPRTDLNVVLDGVTIRPSLALGSWLAFQPMGDQAMVMGDLVLTHEEVNPVLSRLLAGGLTVTALHNHLLRSSPATMYMHISGHGDPAHLARTIRGALEASGTPLSPAPSSQSAESEARHFDIAAVEAIMGAKGRLDGGVYKFGFPRAEAVTDAGHPAPASMGTATAINFQPTGPDSAAVTGDFVLRAEEVDPVLRALRENGIEVTALHNHMLTDEPRLFFMHFWANDDAEKLAQGLRAALDRTNVVRE